VREKTLVKIFGEVQINWKILLLVGFTYIVNLIINQSLASNKEVKDVMSREYEETDIKLQQVGELIHTGKIDDANQILNLLERKEDVPLDYHLKCMFFKSKIKIKRGYFEEGLELAKYTLKKSQELSIPSLEIDSFISMAKALSHLKQFDESLDIIDQGNRIIRKMEGAPTAAQIQRKATLLYLRGQCFIGKGDLDQASTLSQESLKLRKELGDTQEIAESLTSLGRIYSNKGIKDRALEYFKKSLALLKTVSNELEIAWCFWNIGSIYCHRGNTDSALEYFKLSKKQFEKITDKQGNGQALYCMSAMSHDKGELDRALEYQMQCLGFQKQLGNKLEITRSLTKIGFIYLSKGELDQALEYQQQSLALCDATDSHQKSWAFVGIGEIYRLKGELNRALTYLEQSLALRKEGKLNDDIAECLFYIGKIFRQQGNLNSAWEYLEESLTFLEEPDNNLFITAVLLELVSLAIDKRYYEHSDEYLKQLKRFNDQEENKIINQRCRMAKALVLKTSSRIRDKALVQEIFQQIAEEKIVDHRITVAAMYNLCESLLDELKAYGEDSVMLEAKKLAEQLTILAHKHSLSFLTIDALVLQAKLAMVEGNLSKAEELLEQAKLTAKDKKMGSYVITKVSTERRNLEAQYDAWQKLINDNAPFKERLEQAQIKNYLDEALKLARIGKDHKSCE
jgi:tetratricopeptide (TPR) repeat protein